MQDIHPIKPVIETPLFSSVQIFVFFTVILILLVIVIYFLIKKFLKKRIIKEVLVEESDLPEVEEEEIDYKALALEKLEKLKKEIKNEDYKGFFIKLTEILKEFLGYAYKNNFKEMTSSEILKSSELSAQIKNELKIFFDKGDLVKFANKSSGEKLALEMYELVYRFILSFE